MIQIQKNRTKKEPPCGQGGRRKYARSGYINNSSVTSNCGGGVLHATLTPPSLALLAPPSCSQDSTWQAVRACSQNAPVLPLKQHLSGRIASLPPPLQAYCMHTSFTFRRIFVSCEKVQQAAPLQDAFLDLGVGSPLAVTCRKTYSIFASRTMFSEMCVHTRRAGEILKALRLEIAIWLAQERMPRAF